MSEDFSTPQTPPPPYDPHYNPPPPAAPGLTDNAAAALSYVTFIPAVIFLFLAPYCLKPFVKFNAIQSIGLSVVAFCLHFFLIVPILGLVIYSVGWLVLFITWVICIVKASQGNVFKLPFIGDFAAEQSKYPI